MVLPPIVFPPIWGGLWGGIYSPFFPGFAPQPQVFVVPVPAPVAPLAPSPARLAEAADRAAATAPATLTLELPTATAEVWLNGEPQPSSANATRRLSSAALPLGQEFLFRVRARWIDAGTTYEAEQKSTVRAGERGKVTIYAGSPVK